MPANYLTPPPTGRLLIKRGGKDITKTIPKPLVLIDTFEQLPFTFERHLNWFAGSRMQHLETGDYSIEGYQNEITLERKSFSDLLSTVVHCRQRFINECERMTTFKHRAILIEASYANLKTPYKMQGLHSTAHCNGVCGTLDAIEARFNIPIIYTSNHRQLAEEKAASWLSKAATYLWLEQNGLGRILQDGDL